MRRTSADWMPRTTVLAAAGLTVAMIAVGLTASAADAAPIGPVSVRIESPKSLSRATSFAAGPET